MMSATPNGHDSQHNMQNGPIEKDDVYVKISKDAVKGDTLVEQYDSIVGVLTVIGTRHEW